MLQTIIIKEHDGTVKVNSKEGEGSEFIIQSAVKEIIKCFMKSLLILIMVFSARFSYEQNFYNIDSLKLSLKNLQADTSKVLTLAELSFNYAFAKPDTGILYGQQAISLAKKIGDGKSEALAMLCYSWALWVYADYDKAADFALKSLQLFQQRKDYEMIVAANNVLAVIFRDVKDYRMALGYSNAAKKLADSRDLFKKHVNAFAELNSVLTVRSTIYLVDGKLDSAEYYMKKVFSVYPISNSRGFPVTTMGRIAAAKKDYSKALYYFRAAIDTTYGASADNMDSYVEIAGLYFKTGNIDSSIYYCEKVLQIGSNTFYKRAIRDAVYILANCYKKKNMSDSAIKYLEMSIAMNDSLYNQEKLRSIQNLNFNAQLQKQEEDAARAEFQNRVRFYMLLGLLGVFLIIGTLLFRNNHQRKKANALLQAQKNKVESTLGELKSTQAQLIQSEKMASLGELTAGIAHEIQNPLNFVNNFSEVNDELISELVDEVDKGNTDQVKAIANDIRQNLEKINNHGKRADAIVKGMLQHSKTSTGVKEVTDINKLADEYLRLSYHGMRAKDKNFKADFKTAFDESIGKINIVPQDIGRVLLNLYNNAFYAVAEKKKTADENYHPAVSVQTKKINDKVEIIVSDNGNGIPQNIVDKIFQPFFTTKPTGQGTGLGLSLAYDIIKTHGGEIKVETKDDEGSKFIIQLTIS